MADYGTKQTDKAIAKVEKKLTEIYGDAEKDIQKKLDTFMEKYTVKYDYDGDGNLDLLRYDGVREYTALSPGKIDGWKVVDSQGNILGDFYKGEFTPIQEG